MASMGSTQGSGHHTHCDTDNTITQHCDASASLDAVSHSLTK